MKKVNVLQILLICIMSIFIFTGCNSTKASSFDLYTRQWENKNYAGMYDMLSKNSKTYISKEEFIEKYENIYDGIQAKNIYITKNKRKSTKDEITFNLEMDSVAGRVSLDNYKAKVIKERQGNKEGWFLEWNEGLIFPEMEKGDKVRVSAASGKRGEIYDKSGFGLALNGTRYDIGIHPEEYDPANNGNLASILDIDQDFINNRLQINQDPKQFVSLVEISVDNKELLDQLLQIPGVKNQEVKNRVYPGGEAFGSLIGFITPITLEELEKDREQVYHSGSLVGKFGLETVHEEKLRAIDGREVYISKIKDGKETERISVAKKEPKDGKDLHITIDTELQKKIYEEMAGDEGASTAIDPKTGEILAMVSSPSFDSNLYTTYIPNAQKQRWKSMTSDVFINKFNKTYSPGSTFKTVTSIIGLEQGTIEPYKKIKIQGKSWQKDGTWGNYSVNRVNDSISMVDLNDALVYSDNIYFAKSALEIGAENFMHKCIQLGFGKDFRIGFPIARSQVINVGPLQKDILLADTGYGQGEVLMSPLHLSMIYGLLVNDGNIMEPILEVKNFKEGESRQPYRIWEQEVISQDNRKVLLNGLINVIEDPNGTGHSAKIEGIKLAGKTGTAELKESKDEIGKENGWFVAMNVDNPKIVVSMIIEDVGSRGGSHYTIPKVKNVIDYYLKKQ